MHPTPSLCIGSEEYAVKAVSRIDRQRINLTVARSENDEPHGEVVRESKFQKLHIDVKLRQSSALVNEFCSVFTVIV